MNDSFLLMMVYIFETHETESHINKHYPIRSQCTLPYGFLMFSGGRERVHWERMGYAKICFCFINKLLFKLFKIMRYDFLCVSG